MRGDGGVRGELKHFEYMEWRLIFRIGIGLKILGLGGSKVLAKYCCLKFLSLRNVSPHYMPGTSKQILT